MARPFWSGHIQISLVSFSIEMFPATEAKGEIHFHQLSRKTGQRVKHQNVSEGDEPVDKDDIVKGYEYAKGEYVTVEPEDIENLRIPSKNTLDITQFVDMSELDPKFFEKPYFVTPEGNGQIEAFTVVRRALQTTKKVGLGKIAFGGREHLMAIAAPVDESQAGIMAYVLRYADELRDPSEYFGDIQQTKVDADQLSLAEELIRRRSSKFDPSKFTDEYEKALQAMIEAKVNHVAPTAAAPAAKQGKVINLMDALRKSIGVDKTGTANKASGKSSGGSNKIAVLKRAESKSTPKAAGKTASKVSRKQSA